MPLLGKLVPARLSRSNRLWTGVLRLYLVMASIVALTIAGQGLERRCTFGMLSGNSNLFAKQAASDSPSQTVRKATSHLRN